MNDGEAEGFTTVDKPGPPHDTLKPDKIKQFSKNAYDRLSKLSNDLDQPAGQSDLDDTKIYHKKTDETLDKVLYDRLDKEDEDY